MYEVVIQVCYVLAGVVVGCTQGSVHTNQPQLVEQVAPIVYLYDAPSLVTNYYRTRPNFVTHNYVIQRPRHIHRAKVIHHHHGPKKHIIHHHHGVKKKAFKQKHRVKKHTRRHQHKKHAKRKSRRRQLYLKPPVLMLIVLGAFWFQAISECSFCNYL